MNLPTHWPTDELATVHDPHARLAIALLLRAADDALDAVQVHDLGWTGPADDSALVAGFSGIEDVADALLDQWFAVDSSADHDGTKSRTARLVLEAEQASGQG